VVAPLAPHAVDLCRFEGRLRCLPRLIDVRVLWARTDRVAHVPDTWAELLDSEVVFGFPGRESGLFGTFFELVVSRRGRLFDDRRRPTMDTPEARWAVETLVALASRAPSDLPDWHYDDVDAALHAGRIDAAGVWPGGTADVRAAGRSFTGGLPALRQLTIPATGLLPRAASPLLYDDEQPDPWDREFLGAAIDLGANLDERARGFTGQLGPRVAVNASLLKRILPPLADEAGLSDTLVGERSPGEALVGASIVVTSGGPFAAAWDDVFSFRADGARWGLVALDQRVKRDALLGTISDAVGRSPLLFATGRGDGNGSSNVAIGPTTPTTTSPNGGSPTTTAPPPSEDDPPPTAPTVPTPTIPPDLLPVPLPTIPPLPTPPEPEPSDPDGADGSPDAVDVIVGLVDDLLGDGTPTTTIP
jgi:hypothetical protein